MNPNSAFPKARWILFNVGPDSIYNESSFFGIAGLDNSPVQGLYDPTNGTVSRGDILRSNSEGQVQ